MTDDPKGAALLAKLNILIIARQDQALEQIFRHSVHGATLDLQSARQALAEIYRIAKEFRNIEE